ncbi:MAG: hypothetical protein GY832_07980 [Chloroflexi bacterium]|nr:hypothetical protein [Chloroflexota bacterium]
MRITKGDTRRKRPISPLSTLCSPSGVLQVGLLFLAFVAGFVIHQQGWHRPLVTLLTSLVRHPAFTATALLDRSDLPTLYVDVGFEDYQILLDKRSQALRLGANVVSDQDYVLMSVSHDNISVAVEMRLPEGPAKGLEGEVWPFEVLVQDSKTLFDLHRFTLVPADTAVLSTWGYLEALRRADFLSPRYRLIQLVLNGSPKGIYVLEEQLTAESLADGGRPGDAILYFDQGAYWDAYAQLGDTLHGSGFQYARVTADCVSQDETRTSFACADAVHHLQALESGERALPDAMDTEQMGTFLALTTLWRGTSELDWRTVRLAYDPLTARFELIGAGRVLSPVTPMPDYFIDDPLIQMAYARALVEFSHPDYLAQLQADLGNDLEALQQALGIEMGYLELPWTTLETHQAVMRHMITPSHTLFARVETNGDADDALVVRLSNVQPFPVEIVGLDIGENVFLDIPPAWIDESDRALLVDVPDAVIVRAATASVPRDVHLRVPPEAIPRDHEWDWQNPGEIQIVTRLFGLTGQNIIVIAEQGQ